MGKNASKAYPELENPRDYYPYIGHRLGREKDPLRLRESVLSEYRYGAQDPLRGEYLHARGAYSRIVTDIPDIHRRIAADPGAVNILVPRHRSLFDFTLFQPFHHDLVNERIMILAGDNLFVSKMNKALRSYGGFMFLRGDAVLSYPGLPKAYLSKDTYFRDVLPGYLEQEVFSRDKPNHDLMLYLEYEKDARTGKNNGGRTKTGSLRQVNWSMIKLLYDLGLKNGVKTYVTPVNCGFSKIPDAPYVVHQTKLKGALKALRYLSEQNFVYKGYPGHAERHRQAAVESVIRYGEPSLLNDSSDFGSLRGFKRFGETLQADIGKLETVFPLYLIYKAMGQDSEIKLKALADRMFAIHDHYRKKEASFFGLEDGRGNLLPLEEVLEPAVALMNSNPRFGIPGVDGRAFLTLKNGFLRSHDFKLQLWYANNIQHLD
jgi:hypothetical protein